MRTRLRTLVGVLLCATVAMAQSVPSPYPGAPIVYRPPASSSGGSGDVVGPSSSTDNGVARYDGTTGKLLQDSVVLVGDTGNVTGTGTIDVENADTTLSRASAGRVAAEGVTLVGTSTTDTLTNKTLTSPAITSPAISGGGTGYTYTKCQGGPSVATSGTSEEVLATCSLSAGELATNGNQILVTFLTFGANTANADRRIRIRVGGLAGTVVYDTGATNMQNQNVASVGPITITRLAATTATSQGMAVRMNDGGTGAEAARAAQLNRSASITWANAQDVVITGLTPSAAGDLTLASYAVSVVK